jgi:hypothetical protein
MIRKTGSQNSPDGGLHGAAILVPFRGLIESKTTQHQMQLRIPDRSLAGVDHYLKALKKFAGSHHLIAFLTNLTQSDPKTGH